MLPEAGYKHCRAVFGKFRLPAGAKIESCDRNCCRTQSCPKNQAQY